MREKEKQRETDRDRQRQRQRQTERQRQTDRDRQRQIQRNIEGETERNLDSTQKIKNLSESDLFCLTQWSPFLTIFLQILLFYKAEKKIPFYVWVIHSLSICREPFRLASFLSYCELYRSLVFASFVNYVRSPLSLPPPLPYGCSPPNPPPIAARPP